MRCFVLSAVLLLLGILRFLRTEGWSGVYHGPLPEDNIRGALF
jgi:hypothetical protein